MPFVCSNLQRPLRINILSILPIKFGLIKRSWRSLYEQNDLYMIIHWCMIEVAIRMPGAERLVGIKLESFGGS